MRIKQLHISAFGHLVDRSLEELSTGLVIVYGENETGKSTLFSLLSTLLYGFYPVSEFPYRPWHVDVYPEFRAVLELDDSSVAEVHRKLMSTPRATLTWNNSSQDLANRNLPFVDHVSRDLYEALYSPRQSNLHSLTAAEREKIEDRLLGGLGTEVLRSTREVIAELEERAGRLWRPTRRGRQQYRELQDTYNQIRGQRREAVDGDRAIREEAGSLEEVNRRIKELVEENALLSAYLRRTEKLLPIRDKMGQIEGWRSKIETPGAVERLPDGLNAEHQRLSQNVDDKREKVEGLDQDRAELVSRMEVYDEDDESILEHADEIRTWLKQMAAHQQERNAIDDLARKEERLVSALREAADAVLSTPWEEEYYETLSSMVLPDLKVNISSFHEKDRDVDTWTSEARSVNAVRMAGALPNWIPLGLVTLGVISLTLRMFVSYSMLLTIGSIMVLVGVAAIGFNLIITRQLKLLDQKEATERKRIEDLRRQAEADRDEARRKIADALRMLPVATALLDSPDLELYQAIGNLRTKSAGLAQLQNEHVDRKGEWETKQGSLETLLKELGFDPTEPGAFGQAEERFNEALDHRRTMKEASERIEEIDRSVPEAKRKLEEAEGEKEQFEALLEEAVGEDQSIKDLLSRATELQQLAGRIHNAEQELEQEHPNLPELLREIEEIEQSSEEAWTFDPLEIEKSRTRLTEVQDELQNLRERRGCLVNEIEAARGNVTVGELDGQIEQIKEEMEEVCRMRDRISLLASVLKEADRQFREEHQPDVLRRASDYLCTITSCRYQALITMADENGSERLAVVTDTNEHRWVEPPLSGGTLDQIYLSFRLAVVDHLDQGHEILPILLDEALINWDDKRLERSGELLINVAENRQVFLFTCHRWLVEKMQEVTGVNALDLPPQ